MQEGQEAVRDDGSITTGFQRRAAEPQGIDLNRSLLYISTKSLRLCTFAPLR
jgi:hypothetical protein